MRSVCECSALQSQINNTKRGVLINSFWLLDTINFSEFSEVKQRVVPLTQMQIKQTNVNAAINGFIWWCFVCVELQCIEKSGSNSSLSTHYIIIDGSCLGLVHLFFFRFVTGGRMLDGGLFCSRASSAAHSSLSFLYWSSYLPIICRLTHLTTLCGAGSEDSANETEWWMSLSAALTLLIVVTGNTFTHTTGLAVTLQKELSIHWGGLEACMGKKIQ